MTQRERTAIIQKHMFQYAAYKQEIEDYMERAYGIVGKPSETGVHSTFISDPTGRGGVSLAHMPKKLVERRRWCKAIEGAMAECVLEDGDNETGLAYLFKEYFCLDGTRRRRSKNAEAIERICAASGISRSTFFSRMNKITDIVLYYALKKKLI